MEIRPHASFYNPLTQTPATTAQNVGKKLEAANRVSAMVTLLTKAYLASGVTASETVQELMKDVDLHHITPREMAILSGKLHEEGVVSQLAGCSFVSIPIHTEPPIDPDVPIDLFEHYQKRMDVIQELARQGEDESYALVVASEVQDTLYRLAVFAAIYHKVG
ncbi:MAG: hypothetical protein LBI92_10290 [Azoarcus sp.]|jgi:hypothetical protein|nr:hypothetical protein [Azoarcus sp.]